MDMSQFNNMNMNMMPQMMADQQGLSQSNHVGNNLNNINPQEMGMGMNLFNGIYPGMMPPFGNSNQGPMSMSMQMQNQLMHQDENKNDNDQWII